ncbi:Lactose permease [Fusarium oxysporum f. sp. albedinis]|nr:Lactose permease [Fusarium oxysporum f. sp. albedinis]
MRLPEPQGLVLFLQISVLSLWFFFSLCGVQSGQTDGWARANACGKLSENGVDLGEEGRSGDGEDEREDEKARVSNGERARVGSVETTEALCLAGGCAWACWGKKGTEAILYAHCAMTR